MATTTTPLRAPSRSRRPAPRARLPVTFRIGLPIALIGAIGWLGFDAWRATRAQVAFVDASGRSLEVSRANVEFFAFREEPWAASPSERIGEQVVEAADGVTVGEDLVPGQALVRVTAAGQGVGFGYVQLGGGALRVELGPPVVHAGRVQGPGDSPIAGARVEVLGGGARGVLLTETSSDAEGRFVVSGVAESVRVLSLRAHRPGFGTRLFEWPTNGTEELVIRLVPTLPCRGRLVTADPERYAGLEVRVLSLPGVGTELAVDGTFELLGVPGGYPEVYLAIPELPGGQTFRRTAARPGDADVRIELQPEQAVRGRVVNAYSERPLAGAAVSHEHGPRGEEVVLCDADGRFTIGRVPAGPVRFAASATLPRGAVPPAARPGSRSKTVLLQGSVQAVVVPGEALDEELVIRVE